MAGSTISGTITQPVTLGTGNYLSPLSITTTGAVIPATGLIAIYGSITGGSIFNQGAIIQHGTGSAAGDGILLIGAGTINNGLTSSPYALISGTADGLALFAAGGSISVANQGTINGSLSGIALLGGSGFISNGGVIAAGPASHSNTGVSYGGYGIYTKSTAAVTLINNLAGTVSGGIAGIEMIAAASVTNAGLVENAGIIIGGYIGLDQNGQGGIILNSGTIIGTGGSSATGIGLLTAGGVGINNLGVIAGAYGVEIREAFTAPVTLTNSLTGTITGANFGVLLAAASSVTGTGLISNAGNITGGYVGIFQYGEGISIQNTGTISGLGTGTFKGGGIIIDGSGTIINANPQASIYGRNLGIEIAPALSGSLAASGTVVNYGTIASGLASGGAAIVLAGSNDLIIDEPGSVFIGTVSGGTNISTLELGAGSAASIAGLGSQFINFSNIDFAGNNWRAEGNIAGLANGQTIAGFFANDTIILDGVRATSSNYIPNTGLILNGSITLDLTGTFSNASFIVQTIAAGTQIELALCYLAGTRIATPAGDIPIERLGLGDAVITRWHGYRKIKWIGRQSFDPRCMADNSEQLPVCITAGALGHGLPRRDLCVSPGHAMLIGQTLILAKSLVNGVTIRRLPPSADIHYYQLEFESHDCILAEGSWSESFADGPGMRAMFHNAADFYENFPDYVQPACFNRCAERPAGGRALEAALGPIIAHASKYVIPGPLRGWIDHADGANLEGWAIDLANPHLPVTLEISLGDTTMGTAIACHHRADLAPHDCYFSLPLPALTTAQRRTLNVRRINHPTALPMTETCKRDLGISRKDNSPMRHVKDLASPRQYHSRPQPAQS